MCFRGCSLRSTCSTRWDSPVRLAALLLLLFPSLASAQAEPLVYDRPMADMLGAATLPMVIDENTLAGGLFVSVLPHDRGSPQEAT
jgi:hypothetical protein